MRRDVFQAIADPVRRDIIDLLATNERTVNEVAKEFNISRPAISKHIKILHECGLVVISQKGRERYCHIEPGNLVKIANWIDQYRQLWESKIDAFETYVNQLQSKRKNNG